jgi:hypothetical protein
MERTSAPKPVSRTPEEITNYISQWQESGKSKKAFCQEISLNYMTFIGWSTKKKGKKPKKDSESPGFVQLKVKQKESSVFAEIRSADGFVISLHKDVSAEYLRNLLRS